MSDTTAATRCASCNRTIEPGEGRFPLADGILCTRCFHQLGGTTPEVEDLGPSRSLEDVGALASYFDEVLAATPIDDVRSVAGSLATYATSVRRRRELGAGAYDEAAASLADACEGFRETFAVACDVPRVSVGFDDVHGLIRTVPLGEVLDASQLLPYSSVLRFDVIEDLMPVTAMVESGRFRPSVRLCSLMEIDVTTTLPDAPLSTIELVTGPVAMGGATYLRARLARRRIVAKLRQIIVLSGRGCQKAESLNPSHA